MANHLYNLGRFSYRRRRLVAVLWLALLVLLGVGAATLKGPYSSEFSIPGTESSKALDTLAQRFPSSGVDAASANIVLAAPRGQRLDDAANNAAVAAVLAQVKQDPHVVAVVDPFTAHAVSADGRIGLARATYDVSPVNVDASEQKPLFASAKPGTDAGLTVEFSGTAAETKVEPGLGELLGVGVASIVLLALFGSFVAVGIPLLTALVGVGIGAASITTLTGFVSLSQTTPVLGLMLGLAVGIDYALFIMSRFRDELLHGREGEEAAGRAVATAGSAVVFAGLTVIIALLGMLTVNIPFLSYMGVGAAGTIVIAVLVALTLLPALLGFSGRKVLGRRALVASDQVELSAGHRWVQLIARRPRTVLVVALLGLGLLAVPALSLKTALPDDGSASTQNTNRRAYDLLSEAFGPGSNGPLVVVVESSRGVAAAQAVGAALAKVDGAVAVLPPVANPAGDTFLLSVVPKGSPASDQTKALVSRIRHGAAALEKQTGTTIAVTGHTAIQIDVSNRLASAMPIYLLVVVGLALILLTIVFRSVLVPLKAALGFLLTLATTFGAVVAIFQWGWFSGPLDVTTTGPILSILPIFMIGIIFGLAMDYEVFLVTRMREEHVHGADATAAVVDGFRHGARVVSGAAIIMISVFASFMLSPDATTKSLGFAFAFGIAIDAFVVRMTVVPAVMVLLGERAWWLPGWLDRFVPRVDVEGEGLRVLDEAELALTKEQVHR